MQAFFRDVLALPHTVGHDGRAVFTRSPGSAGVHPDVPATAHGGAGLRPGTVYLTCDVLADTIAELIAVGATITEVSAAAEPSVVLWVHRFHAAVALRPRRSPGTERAGVAHP